MLEQKPQFAAVDAAGIVKLLHGHLHIVASRRADESEGTGELAQRSDQDLAVGDALAQPARVTVRIAIPKLRPQPKLLRL